MPTLLAELLLLIATAIWGGGYLITRDAVHSAPPFMFVAVRFLVASLAITLLARPRLDDMRLGDAKAGATIACAMIIGYVSQAFAMIGMAAGRTAFINALYVPLVPVMLAVTHRAWPGKYSLIAIALSLLGLALLTGPGGGGFGWGEMLAFIGALGIATEILTVAHFAPGHDPKRLAVAQCVSLSGLCFAAAWLHGDPIWGWWHQRWAIAACGLGGASAFLQISVNWAMRHVPAGRATLIYATEPVWAALFGALSGERMSPRASAGTAAILLSLLLPKDRKNLTQDPLPPP